MRFQICRPLVFARLSVDIADSFFDTRVHTVHEESSDDDVSSDQQRRRTSSSTRGAATTSGRRSEAGSSRRTRKRRSPAGDDDGDEDRNGNQNDGWTEEWELQLMTEFTLQSEPTGDFRGDERALYP